MKAAAKLPTRATSDGDGISTYPSRLLLWSVGGAELLHLSRDTYEGAVCGVTAGARTSGLVEYIRPGTSRPVCVRCRRVAQAAADGAAAREAAGGDR